MSIGLGFLALIAGGNSFDCTKYYPSETISAVTLTFPGDVSTNPDLQYFKAGDIVQGRQLTGIVQWTSNSGTSWDAPGVNEQSPYTVGERFTPKTANRDDVIHFWTMIKLDSPITQGIKYDLNMNGSWTGNPYQFQLFTSNDGVTWIDKGTSTLPATIGAGESWQYFAVYNGTQGDSRSDEAGDFFYSWFFDPGQQHKVISTGYPDSNTMVVDGGSWDTSNQSQVWSNGVVSSTGDYYRDEPPTAVV